MDILENINTDLKILKDYNDVIKKKTNTIMELSNSQEKLSVLQLAVQLSELMKTVSDLYLDSMEKYKIFSELYIDNQIKARDILIQIKKISIRINEF
jgi:hypothetical protein